MQIPIREVMLGETFKFKGVIYKRVYANLPYETKYIIVIAKPGEDGEHITYFDDQLQAAVEVDRQLTFAELKEGDKFYWINGGVNVIKVKGIDGKMVAINTNYVYHVAEDTVVERIA